MTTLTIGEAVRLCTAWSDRLARDQGVRALVIKGHVLSAQGLRGGYESMDVDLLVDPADFDRFLGVLADHGWSQLTVSTAPTIIAMHAVTITHLRWPITMDVHHYFPGFLADPQVVFDLLWRRRTTARVAEVDVQAPDPVGHAALVALHYLRDPASARSGHHMPDLSVRTRELLTRRQIEELADVAAQTGASATLAPFLEELGAPRISTDGSESEALAAWRLRTSGSSSLWFVGLAGVPLWRWPTAIWRAIWLSDAEIATYHQRGDEGLGQARWRRLRKGLRGFPSAVRDLVAYTLRSRLRRRPR